jgi:hypothetical protein
VSGSFKGRLLHIHVARAASAKMEELEEANLVAGRGIEGDRYFLGTGIYSATPDIREVTLIELEVYTPLRVMIHLYNQELSLSHQPITGEISPPRAFRSIICPGAVFASVQQYSKAAG